MRLLYLVLLLLLRIQFQAHGQDGVIERRFAKEKEKIKANGIEEITEFESIQRSNQACDSTKLKAIHKYKFDQYGNLIQATDYLGSSVKTIVYSRNEKGEYTAKDYLYFDMRGNLQAHEVWKLDFNDQGQLVRERLLRDNELLRTNTIEYNELGQRSSQISDSTHKWTMKYDERGNLVEFKEWRKLQSNDFVYVGTSSYQYAKDLLIHEISQSENTLEGSSELVYQYDANSKLVEMVEKRMRWKRLSDGRTESEITVIKTVNRNNDKGDVVKSSVFIDAEPLPFKCKFFTYLERGN